MPSRTTRKINEGLNNNKNNAIGGKISSDRNKINGSVIGNSKLNATVNNKDKPSNNASNSRLSSNSANGNNSNNNSREISSSACSKNKTHNASSNRTKTGNKTKEISSNSKPSLNSDTRIANVKSKTDNSNVTLKTGTGNSGKYSNKDEISEVASKNSRPISLPSQGNVSSVVNKEKFGSRTEPAAGDPSITLGSSEVVTTDTAFPTTVSDVISAVNTCFAFTLFR